MIFLRLSSQSRNRKVLPEAFQTLLSVIRSQVSSHSGQCPSCEGTGEQQGSEVGERGKMQVGRGGMANLVDEEFGDPFCEPAVFAAQYHF